MKKLLRFIVAIVMFATAQAATAQVKMAPNYFRADPAVYKYRMAKVIDWKNSEDEELTQYIYDEKGCLIKEEYGSSDNPGTSFYNYKYNSQGYMILKEEEELNADQTSLIISAKHVYTRNEYGYVTEYTRATHHGTEPEEEMLTEDVKMSFVYDAQMRLIRVDIRQFDYPLNKLEENVGRICKVTYDDAGRVICVSQEYPDGELVWKEDFKYDEKGRRTSIEKVPGPNYTAQNKGIWTWHYDNEGDIDKQSSSNGFGKEFEYDKSKLASETFMVLEATEAEWVLQGPLNCTLFKGLPMEKYFVHAPMGETTDESEITYEPTGTPGNIGDAPTVGKSLQAHLDGNKLTVDLPAALIGKTLQVFNTTGACMSSFVVNGLQATFNIDNFTPGIYVVSIGNQTVKFIKR
ncbi:T9SS type A sorting domain-containing protein [Prevotella falsenii]|uniref:T9SS type A sorting domain-containing protein n=1 Tax=Prevotella falsenii TaxID=515414 RepID=UPI000469ADC5|nr:T9SS type A sorting domain-containing protein [Prevotella falsenii]